MRRSGSSVKDRMVARPIEGLRGFWKKTTSTISPKRRRRRGRLKKTAAVTGAITAGAGAAYYLDPARGKSRRARTRDRIAGGFRRIGRRGGRLKRRVESDVEGFAERVRHAEETPPPNDATLAHKVESEILGRPDVPKGSVNVDAAQGVVALRGTVKDPDLIGDLAKRVEKIPGVRGVENYLHMPGTPAPNKREARRASTG